MTEGQSKEVLCCFFHYFGPEDENFGKKKHVGISAVRNF